MRRAAGWLLLLLATDAGAATVYVTDELVLGVYSAPNAQGQRLATLHSGAQVETLATGGEFTQIRMASGETGWVKSSFLTPREPASLRARQLQDELDRSHATTPALAEAAARSEVERLQRELNSTKDELTATRAQLEAGRTPQVRAAAPERGWRRAWPAVAAAAVALLLGIWIGHAALARRVRAKFGGIKVY